eukprot:768221-Hanusia_phi.AAC.5
MLQYSFGKTDQLQVSGGGRSGRVEVSSLSQVIARCLASSPSDVETDCVAARCPFAGGNISTANDIAAESRIRSEWDYSFLRRTSDKR